jgi:hypothetical protein
MFSNSVNWVRSHLILLRLREDVMALLDVGLPEGTGLSFFAASEIAKVPQTIQAEVAHKIITEKMNIGKVRHYIRHLLVQHGGTGVRERKRKASDDIKIFWSFIASANEKADQLLDLPGGKTLTDIYRQTDWIKIDKMVEETTALLNKLKRMLDQVRAAQTGRTRH